MARPPSPGADRARVLLTRAVSLTWILRNANATQADLLQWLRGLYARPDMARRFAGGLP